MLTQGFSLRAQRGFTRVDVAQLLENRVCFLHLCKLSVKGFGLMEGFFQLGELRICHLLTKLRVDAFCMFKRGVTTLTQGFVTH